MQCLDENKAWLPVHRCVEIVLRDEREFLQDFQ